MGSDAAGKAVKGGTGAKGNGKGGRGANMQPLNATTHELAQESHTVAMPAETETPKVEKCWCVDLAPPEDISRESDAGCMNSLFVMWVEKLLHLGNQRQLSEEDLGVMDEIDTARYQCELFQRSFEARTKPDGTTPGLWPVIFDTVNMKQAFLAILCAFLHAVTSFIGVLILNSVVAHFEGKPGKTLSDAMLWLHAFGGLFVPCFGGLCFAHRMQMSARLGGRVRAAMMSLIYRKSLRLHSLSEDSGSRDAKKKDEGKGGKGDAAAKDSRGGRGAGGGSIFACGGKKEGGKGGKGKGKGGKGGGTAMGKVVMLMSADAQKFVDGVQNVATLVVFPFQA